MMEKSNMMILIAGPYRSGTNDEPARIEANVKAMTDAALEIYKMGHLPVLGEWFALPLIAAAGSGTIGDSIFNELFHPVALRPIPHCDAVVRIGEASAGADQMVREGILCGKLIFHKLQDIPVARNGDCN